jgi:hypothetical protein
MAQRTTARWPMLAAPLLLLGLLAGCASGGPLQTLMFGGQPSVDLGGLEVHPGQSADFTAFVVNPLNSPVTLLSATVVPVTGTRPTGRLVHLGIGEGNGMIASAAGWPVPAFTMRQFAGARIGHGQSNIIFGMTGWTVGTNYTAAGLKIRYRYQGQVYSVIAWSAAVACVARIFTGPRACPDIGDQTQAKVDKMAEGS